MAKIDEEALKKQIREKTFSNLYLFYGEESYLKQQYVSRIIKKTTDESFRAFNLHSLDGKNTTLDIIAECCFAVPMMGDYSVTVVHDMELSKLDSASSAKLKELISDVPETTILIFWQDTVNVDVKDKKWSELIKNFDNFGSAVCLMKKTQSDLVKMLISGAKKRECVLTPDNARYLISIVGDDLNVLLNELEKLCFFTDKGEITKGNINLVAVKSLDATAFMLTKFLIAGNFEKAYEVLDTLYHLKTEPTLIMGAIISTYVDMYRAKVAVTNGESSTAPAKAFNYRGREFRLTNGARDAGKLSILQLRNALEILAEADEKLKTNYEESKTRLIIEEAMVRLVMI